MATIASTGSELLGILNALRKVPQAAWLSYVAVCAQPQGRSSKLVADAPTNQDDTRVRVVRA